MDVGVYIKVTCNYWESKLFHCNYFSKWHIFSVNINMYKQSVIILRTGI